MEGTMTETTPGLHRLEHIMGMPIGIDVRDSGVDPGILEDVFTWFRWVDATFSTYKPESDISRLNLGELALDDVHPEVRFILQRCEELEAETNGYFNIHAPMLPPEVLVSPLALTSASVDPSGLVKGWSVDRGARILEDAGLRNFSINAGGDVLVRGGALPASRWRIGIQHPFVKDRVAAVVETTDGTVATSGTYERGNHIVDPHTGLASTGVLSVTITGPELGTADAYATAAFAMGKEGPAWTARLVARGYEAMTILADHQVLSTPGFPSV